MVGWIDSRSGRDRSYDERAGRGWSGHVIVMMTLKAERERYAIMVYGSHSRPATAISIVDGGRICEYPAGKD